MATPINQADALRYYNALVQLNHDVLEMRIKDCIKGLFELGVALNNAPENSQAQKLLLDRLYLKNIEAILILKDATVFQLLKANAPPSIFSASTSASAP